MFGLSIILFAVYYLQKCEDRGGIGKRLNSYREFVFYSPGLKDKIDSLGMMLFKLRNPPDAKSKKTGQMFLTCSVFL